MRITSRRKLLGVLFVPLALAAPTGSLPGILGAPASAAASKWKTYFNDRFGFQFTYPGVLIAQTPPANGDGGEFWSKDGSIKLIAYGSLEVDADGASMTSSIAEVQSGREEDLVGRSGKVTYRVTKPTSFVSSGVNDAGQIFYEKYERKYGYASTMLLTYPQSAAKTWNAYTTRIAKSFVVTSCSETYVEGCA